MSSFVRYRDEEIDLSAVTPSQMAALWKLYEDRRSRRGGHRMPLQCVKPHGGRMYLKVRNDRLWVAHYPGEGDPSCSVMRVEPESATHRRMRDTAPAPWNPQGTLQYRNTLLVAPVSIFLFKRRRPMVSRSRCRR